MDCSTPGSDFPVLYSLLKFVQTHVHCVDDAVQPSHPLLHPSPPALNLSQHQGLFQWVSSLDQVVKVLELQLHISPSNEYLWLISFKNDWLDFLAAQGTLKSLLQHHISKASIFWCSAFLMVQLSHLYMTTGKTIALIIQNFGIEMMSHFIICCLGLSYLSFQEASFFFFFLNYYFMAAETVCCDFGAQENKVCLCFHFFSIYIPWSDGIGCPDLSFLNAEF